MIEVRRSTDDDRRALAELFVAIAEERDGIAAEPPLDVERMAARLGPDRNTLVATVDGVPVGMLHVDDAFGHGELGMSVAREWRGRGVGTALMEVAIREARERGLHKLSLGVFPHNAAGIALYRKFGFVEEGLRKEHIRRRSGEHWDLLEMGLLL